MENIKPTENTGPTNVERLDPFEEIRRQKFMEAYEAEHPHAVRDEDKAYVMATASYEDEMKVREYGNQAMDALLGKYALGANEQQKADYQLKMSGFLLKMYESRKIADVKANKAAEFYDEIHNQVLAAKKGSIKRK